MPELEPEIYNELKEDIRNRGVMVPIEYDEQGNVLDGYNRLKICQELGITEYPKVIRYNLTETEKRLHARKLNLARRHMSQEQRRELIKQQLRETPEVSDRQIAKGLGVSHKTVGKQRGELAGRGEIPHVDSVKDTLGRQQPRKPISLFNPTPKEERAIQDSTALLDKLTTGEAKSVIDAQRILKKEAAIKQHGTPKPQGVVDIYAVKNKYRVIYADPPWAYGDPRSGQGITGATDHYPTMPLKEICALPVKDITEDNAVLFLWVTSPLLEESFEVIKAWGFKYKSSFVWDKIGHNMGHYNSVRHEFLLICTKGSCTPDNVKLFDSVQSIQKTEHSRKPEEFREIIDTLYQVGNRIELFARKQAEKWDAWGYEA
jgi:N6-adenosine-specific RNA methylase IME4